MKITSYRSFARAFAAVWALAAVWTLSSSTLLGAAETEAGTALPAIPNASFEVANAEGTMPYEWNGPKENFARDTDVVRSGAASFRWTNSDPARYPLSSARVKSLLPGHAYRVSGWVKTKNVTGGSASICVEWSGTDGKWLGGAYLQGVRGTNDWKQIQTIVRVPENAVNPHVTCYGTKDAVGTAWFDDLEIQPYFPPVVTAMTTDHYRAQTIGGEVKLHVGLGYDEKQFTPELQKQIFVEISEAAGGKVVQTLRTFTLSPRQITFAFDSSTLPNGSYVLTLHLPSPGKGTTETASLKLTKLETFPERKAYFDEHQRLIVDGKPFFPFGLYFHRPAPEDVERLADSPFNCIMSYPGMPREMLDSLHAHGIRSIYSVKDFYEGLAANSDEEGRKKTIERINSLKDHPAIIAWYVNDELPLSMRDVLSAHRDLVEELDPGRPAWAVLYQIEEIRDYLPTYDVIGTDPYPISSKPASMAYVWAKKTHDACFGCRPCWQVPQYFNWQNYRKNDEKDRTPTYDEMRAMTWMALAGGANGIIGYSYFDFFRNYADGDGSPEARKASFDRTWEDVCRIGREIRRYESVLLSVETPETVTPRDGSAPAVVTRLYAQDGAVWLMAVNTETEKKTAEFTIPAGMKVRNAQDWPGLKLSQDGSVLKVELEGLAPAFLQLAR